jgi:CBS domain-containing protein
VKTLSGFILVRDVMAKNIKTVRTDDTVLSAVKKMNKFDIGSVIVVSSGRPVGILTEKNILQRVVESRVDAAMIWVKDIMSSPLVSIEPTAAIEEAAKIMAEKKINRLPVMENNKLVGLISSTDIVRANPTQLGILNELLKVS